MSRIDCSSLLNISENGDLSYQGISLDTSKVNDVLNKLKNILNGEYDGEYKLTVVPFKDAMSISIDRYYEQERQMLSEHILFMTKEQFVDLLR